MFDLYLVYNFMKMCDVRRVATVERFNVVDVERYCLEIMLDVLCEILFVIDVCVDVIYGDESEIF